MNTLSKFKAAGRKKNLGTATSPASLISPEAMPRAILITPAELAALIRQEVQAQLPKLLEEAKAKPGPLAAARARGDAYKRSELANPENLTLSEAAKRTGFSEKWINTLRQRGELYALVAPERERGFRYPAWQFDSPKGRLLPVLNALSKAGVERWGVHAFMNNASRDLQGRAPRDYIQDPDAPLMEVLKVIASRFVDEQGAQ